MQSELTVADAVPPRYRGQISNNLRKDCESVLTQDSVSNEVRLNWWQIFPIGSICFLFSESFVFYTE